MFARFSYCHQPCKCDVIKPGSLVEHHIFPFMCFNFAHSLEDQYEPKVTSMVFFIFRTFCNFLHGPSGEQALCLRGIRE